MYKRPLTFFRDIFGMRQRPAASLRDAEDRPEPVAIMDTCGFTERTEKLLQDIQGRVDQPSTPRRIGIVVPTTISCMVPMMTLLTAAKVNAEPLVVLDSIPDTGDMIQQLNQIEVLQEEPMPRERSWVEMNQPYKRQRKRSRPGRKHGKT